MLERLRNEYVVLVTGTVRARSSANAKVATGNVEVLAESVTILNTVTRSLPFSVSGTEAASEEVRLKYVECCTRERLRTQHAADALRPAGTARWTCAARRCPTTCACATASSWRCGACWRRTAGSSRRA